VWLALALVAGSAGHAHAAEAPTFADRDAPVADGRDRSLALLINPIAFAYGLFGAEGDFVLTSALVATVEVDAARLPSRERGAGANAVFAGTSLVVYPSGSALHALYMSGRVAFARPWREPQLRFDFRADVVECGLRAGWHWTWDYGLSVRVGAGPLLAVGGRPPIVSPELVLGPVRLALDVDASIGWAF
jgi:hypothetical protein